MSRVPVESRIFSSPCRPDRFRGTPSLLSNGYQRVKRPGREAHHSSLTNAKIKKTGIYTSTPPYAFMAQRLISLAQGQLLLYYETGGVFTQLLKANAGTVH
jgi:hypothetical protein